MAGPNLPGQFFVQRVAAGLLEVFGLKGHGQNPLALVPTVQPTVDLLQMYARSQRISQFIQNAAAAEGTAVSLVVPDNQTWVLLHCFGRIVQTATMTALRGNVQIESSVVAEREPGSYGATVTGVFTVPFVPPYPMVLLPRTVVSFRAAVIGTDATADISLNAVVGVMQ